jgi:hypothetical protein
MFARTRAYVLASGLMSSSSASNEDRRCPSSAALRLASSCPHSTAFRSSLDNVQAQATNDLSGLDQGIADAVGKALATGHGDENVLIMF